MECVALERVRSPWRRKATSNDQCQRFATRDLRLVRRVRRGRRVRRVRLVDSSIAGRRFLRWLAAAVDEFLQEECPFSSSACVADRAAGLSCPARSVPSTCRSCSFAGGASALQPARHTRVSLALHAKRRHPSARFPERDSQARLPRPVPRRLGCWGSDSPRSLLSLTHHDSRSAKPSCPEVSPAR